MPSNMTRLKLLSAPESLLSSHSQALQVLSEHLCVWVARCQFSVQNAERMSVF